MKNTFYSQGNPYNIVRVTGNTHTASVNELIIADETEITLPSGVPAGSVIAVRSSGPDVTTDVVGASDSVDGFSQGTTHQEAKTGEYVYDGSDWYLRNSVDVSDGAIPDRGDLYAHYDFSQYDTSTTTNIADLSGNDNDLTSGSITGYGSINGVQSGTFDGTADTLYGASLPSNPNTVAAVFKLDSDADLNTEHQVANFNDDDFQRLGWNSGKWELYQGSGISGSTNSGVNILVGYLDGGGNSILREDGSQTASGDIGNGGSSDISLGSAEPERSERYFDGEIGEVLFYDSDKSGIFGEIESYLAGKWGISI